MRTPEEIEKLAEQIANKHSKHNGEIIGNPRAIMLGIEAIQAVKEGYTQCQQTELKEALEELDFYKTGTNVLQEEIERLKSEKKYTEEDMRKAMYQTWQNAPERGGYEYQLWENSYIQSLKDKTK